jgi:hypothetical protein
MSSKKAHQSLLFSSTYLRRREPILEISIGYNPNSAQNALQVLKIGLITVTGRDCADPDGLEPEPDDEDEP